MGRQYSSQSFLYTKNERLDAAYLIALHFGGNGPGVSGEAEDNLGRALDKRLEVFLTYKTSLYPNSAEPKINFESYCMLVSGIRAGAIDVHTCPDCGTRHPWNAERLGLPICPACTVMDLRVRAGRQEIDGDKLFALVSEYSTEPKEKRRAESAADLAGGQSRHGGSA